MAVIAQNKIYSNDGATLLYTTGTLMSGSDEGLITETGIDFIRLTTTVPIHLESYIYEGDKKFVGVSTTPNSTIPEYTIGESFTAGAAGAVNFYIVETNITDLRNTTWYVPSGWTCIAGYGDFNGTTIYVDFNNSGIEEIFHHFFIGYSNNNHTAKNTIYFLNVGNEDGTAKTNDTSFTIRFGDASIPMKKPLIFSWLETNGKLISGGTPDEPTDTKPVYKQVNGAWVKQTAYERVNGEWVKISSRRIDDVYNITVKEGTSLGAITPYSTNPMTISSGETATLKFYWESSNAVPSEISTINCENTSSYTGTTSGVLTVTLTNATDDVIVNIQFMKI